MSVFMKGPIELGRNTSYRPHRRNGVVDVNKADYVNHQFPLAWVRAKIIRLSSSLVLGEAKDASIASGHCSYFDRRRCHCLM